MVINVKMFNYNNKNIKIFAFYTHFYVISKLRLFLSLYKEFIK